MLTEPFSKISIIIPVYNSANILPELLKRIVAECSTHILSFEVLLINDASLDNSWQVIQELVNQYPSVLGINLNRNFGQHNAILCGIQQARGELIVTMDDDLQHHPESIPLLIQTLQDHDYDVVYGYPEKEQHGLFRDIPSQLIKVILQEAMGVKVGRYISAFRVFKASLREAFKDYHSPFVNIDVLLSWGTTNFGALKVKHSARLEGRSNYNFFKLFNHAFNMLTGFSVWPLRLASILGFALTLFGFFILFYVLLRFFMEGNVVPGFPFLASIIAIFSGAQLFSLGIIGEYLARMYFRTMQRPAFLIKEKTDDI